MVKVHSSQQRWSLAVLVALGAALACPGSVHAQGRPTADPELATLDDRALVSGLEKEVAQGNDRALADMETLLARVARTSPIGEAKNPPRDELIEITDDAGHVRYESLHHVAWRLLQKLPKDLRKHLQEAQVAALSTERARGAEDEDRLLERYPLVADMSASASALAARAFEAADDLGATSLDRLADRLAALATGQAPPRSTAARIRRAIALLRAHELEAASEELQRARRELDAAKDPVAARTLALVQKRVDAAFARRLATHGRRPPDGFVPDLLASYRFSRQPLPTPPDAVAPVPAHVGNTVFASDGSRLLIVDADAAEIEGRWPTSDAVPPPATGVPGTVTALGDLVIAPLFFERFALPARGSLEDRPRARPEDSTFRDGYFSLFIFDGPARRLLWWDSDVGPRSGTADDGPSGRPAGLGELDETSWERLARAHVVGRPLADGRRIYVPLVTTSGEPQTWVAAYERATGDDQPLALVSVWRTFLASTLVSGPAATAPSPVPGSNPRLALDPDGRVIVQTDLGIVAALDARTGAIEWLVRLGDDEPQGRFIRRRGEEASRLVRPSNDPPVVIPGRGARAAVVVLASPEERDFVALSAEDGSIVWRESFDAGGFTGNGSESARVTAVAPDVVALYGGCALSLVDGVTGKALLAAPAGGALDANEWPAGPIAPAGNGAFVLPLSGGRGRTGHIVVRRGPPADPAAEDREQVPLEASLALGDTWALREADGPLGALCLDGRLVVVSEQTVNVYCWRKPE